MSRPSWMDWIVLLILCTVTFLSYLMGVQLNTLENRVTILEKQVSTYNDNAVEMFSGYNEMRKTQLTLISLYEDNGKFNK